MSERARKQILRAVLREPLVHFALIGGLLLAIWSLLPRDEPEVRRDTIVVTQGKVDQLIDAWTRTRLRPPTHEELRGLIDAHVREEILYREALAIGLDEDDTVIRRRLAQKMEFLAQDVADIATPTDDELRALLDAEPERFAEPDRVTLRHVFLDPGNREDVDADAAALLASLRAGTADPDAASDSRLMPATFEDAALGEVRRALGDSFADAIPTLPIGEWAGPVRSGFGVHLVRVSSRIPGRVPPLEDVRADVEREWMARRRERLEQELVEALRDRYIVEIEPLAEDEP
jgi:parvulin-like peptidyl-prolyl isomerase